MFHKYSMWFNYLVFEHCKGLGSLSSASFLSLSFVLSISCSWSSQVDTSLTALLSFNFSSSKCILLSFPFCLLALTAVMSLASWYDSIPFHFCILVFPLRRWLTMMHGTDAMLHTSCASPRDHERAQCLIFIKSLLLVMPLFGNV